MSTVKFGRGQLNNPTPASIATGVHIFTLIAGALIAWIGTADFIPSHLSGVLQSILGLLLTICNLLKPFFGIETSETTVPISEVTAMEDPKT